jgi:esterase/lipase superfamily enzyme
MPHAATIFGKAGVALLAAALVASGCAGPSSHDLIARVPAVATAAEIAGSHTIFVATTRARAQDPREVFSGARSAETSYASVDVTVPAAHEVGAVERPKGDVADPAKYFTATRVVGYRDPPTFSRTLGAEIARRGGRALVFVHGYKTGFDSAVYRATQIAHDSGYTGAPVLFSWASGGRALDYVYDNNSATAARDALEQTLRLVAGSGAKRIDIVAHSMGNWVTMEALRQLAISGNRDLDNRLGDVVLASPDIDVDVFKAQMRRYGVPDKPFFVLTSKNDRALNLSGLIAGSRPRVGDYKDAKDLASYGVIVADLSAVSAGDRFNHTKFADNPILVKLLGERLDDADGLGVTEGQITERVGALAAGLGQTLTSAAEIIITTPGAVLNVAIGN